MLDDVTMGTPMVAPGTRYWAKIQSGVPGDPPTKSKALITEYQTSYAVRLSPLLK